MKKTIIILTFVLSLILVGCSGPDRVERINAIDVRIDFGNCTNPTPVDVLGRPITGLSVIPFDDKIRIVFSERYIDEGKDFFNRLTTCQDYFNKDNCMETEEGLMCENSYEEYQELCSNIFKCEE